MATRTVQVDELTERMAQVFERLGIPAKDAQIVADHQVEVHLLGVQCQERQVRPTCPGGILAKQIAP